MSNPTTLPEILETYAHEHFNDQGADFDKLRKEAQDAIYQLGLDVIGHGKVYKSKNNYKYWLAQKHLRAEQRKAWHRVCYGGEDETIL
jgi:hypothetical protein